MVDNFDPKTHYDKSLIGPPEIAVGDKSYYSMAQALEFFRQIAGDERNPHRYVGRCQDKCEFNLLVMANRLAVESNLVGRVMVAAEVGGCLMRPDSLKQDLIATELIKNSNLEDVRNKLKSDEGLYIRWDYHVAVTIEVFAGGKLMTLVIDPSLSDKLLSIDRWLARIQKIGEYLVLQGKVGHRPNLLPEFLSDRQIAKAAEILGMKDVADQKKAVIATVKSEDGNTEKDKFIERLTGRETREFSPVGAGDIKLLNPRHIGSYIKDFEVIEIIHAAKRPERFILREGNKELDLTPYRKFTELFAYGIEKRGGYSGIAADILAGKYKTPLQKG